MTPITLEKKRRAGEIPFRKAYLRSLIDTVEVGDRVIRIHGSKTVLERAVLADQARHPGVRSFVRNWLSGVSACETELAT